MTLQELADMWRALTGGWVTAATDELGEWSIVLGSNTIASLERQHRGEVLDEAIDSAVLAIAAWRSK